MRRAVWGALVCVSVCSVFVEAQATGDSAPAIAIGETAVAAGDSQLSAALSAAMASELERRSDVRLARGRRDARYVMRGSVVQLEERNVSDGLEVRCAVSIVVADAHGGSVRALLFGRAGARGVDDRERLTRAALYAAVRGALRAVGQHLR